MKKLRQALLALLLGAVAIGVSPMVGTASATLIYQQHGLEKVVYDTNTDTYWLQDLTKFANQTYQQQMSNISINYAGLEYFGISNWHMASAAEIKAISSYVRDPITVLYAFNPILQIVGNDLQTTWSGRYDEESSSYGPSYHGALAVYLTESLASPSVSEGWGGYLGTAMPDDYLVTGAWVVGTKSAPVPEPATMLLVAVGLAVTGFFGASRRSVLSRR